MYTKACTLHTPTQGAIVGGKLMKDKAIIDKLVADKVRRACAAAEGEWQGRV